MPDSSNHYVGAVTMNVSTYLSSWPATPRTTSAVLKPHRLRCGNRPSPASVIVAVDNNEGLADHLRNHFDWISVVLNCGAPGASATRNRGVEISQRPLRQIEHA